MRSPAGAETQWRSWLRRKIGWLLLAKLIALILLWNMSFSPEHRLAVTPGRMDALLALDEGPAEAPGESADD
jgi:hypothetical protein